MKIEALQEKVDRVIPAPPALWAWAAMLGEARTLSNDGRRGVRADRGAGNRDVDLLGAFSELLLLGWASRLYPPLVIAEMAAHLYHPQGGREVKGADLRLPNSATGLIVGVDAKSFDCSPRKRYFAINDAKHRALGGGCDHYFCVLAAPYGTQAAVARLVPYVEVEDWSVVGLRPGGTPSRNLEIGVFLRRYFSQPPAPQSLRSDCHSRDIVERLKRDPGCRARLCALIPSLPAG